MKESIFFTVAETAQHLGVNCAQVYALVKKKGFPCKRIGRHYMVHRLKLGEWSMDFNS